MFVLVNCNVLYEGEETVVTYPVTVVRDKGAPLILIFHGSFNGLSVAVEDVDHLGLGL